MNTVQKPAISPWQQRMAADKAELRKTAPEADLEETGAQVDAVFCRQLQENRLVAECHRRDVETHGLRCNGMNNKAPCHGCEIRFIGCHAVCMRYEAWRLTRNAERAKARLEKSADDVLITGCMREKERKRKKLGR